jgi:tetratricopeptide (TPR) repeat protein
VLGDDHPETLRTMGGLAVLYRNQSRYDEAEPLFLETLETRKRVLGDDHPDTLWSMNNLGILYQNQGRYDEAEPLFLETLETRKRVLGDGHPDTLDSLYNLSCFAALRGNPAKAMDWLRQATDAGFSDADWLVEDSDLASLHGPEFDALVERVRQNAAAPQH